MYNNNNIFIRTKNTEYIHGNKDKMLIHAGRLLHAVAFPAQQISILKHG
jgi:uncharacterized protein YbcV (DUF1398 family)